MLMPCGCVCRSFAAEDTEDAEEVERTATASANASITTPLSHHQATLNLISAPTPC